MEELLPCPFCGKVPIIKKKGTLYTIVCENRGCDVMSHTLPSKRKEGAVFAWNKRQRRQMGRK